MTNNLYDGLELKEIKPLEYQWPKDGVTDGVTYTIAKELEPIGYWVLGSGGYSTINFAMYVKPTADQIYNTEMLLGWKWKDAIKYK
jgi:hypothetical protein